MLGLIGGTGLNAFEGMQQEATQTLVTACGEPSAPIQLGVLDGMRIAFLPRHGDGHRVPPHAINYRANMLALQQLGVTCILGVAAVGGITQKMAPGELVLPDDLIDYTWGREHSYSLGADDKLQHVEFAPPYDEAFRQGLLLSAQACDVPVQHPAVHGVTQGPRLETAAEIRRLARDGCDIVGMTGMPEAVLAAELGLPYVCLAVVVNWAAGISNTAIHAEIEQHIATGIGKAKRVIQGLATL